MIIELTEASNQSFRFLKTFNQDEIDALAEIAPNCDLARNRWGDYSMWVVSVANRAVKSNASTVQQILKSRDRIGLDLQAFAIYKKELGNNIDRFKNFDELHAAVSKYIENGKVVNRIAGSQMPNRIRTAYKRMKRDGMTPVFEDNTWFIVSPDSFGANQSMSSVGLWCHTGANTSDGLRYWDEYTGYGPLYYILNKKDGYVLCHTYARQYEIRDQLDRQPWRVEAGFDVWDFNIGGTKPKDRPRTAVEFSNNETDWNSLFDFLDKSGKVKKAITDFERNYDRTVQERFDKLIKTEFIDPLSRSVNDGILTVTDENIKIIYDILHSERTARPDPDDYEDGEDGDGWQAAAEQAESINNRKLKEYQEYMMPHAKKFFAGIKRIRFGNAGDGTRQFDFLDSARRHLFGNENGNFAYDGDFPVIDMQGVTGDAVGVFTGFPMKKAPVIVNTDGVSAVNEMFKNSRIEEFGDVAFKNATSAAGMFSGCGLTRKIGSVILSKCVYAQNMFNGTGASNPGASVYIGEIVMPDVENPLNAMGISNSFQNQMPNARFGNIDVGSDDSVYERLKRTFYKNRYGQADGNFLWLSAVLRDMRGDARIALVTNKIKRSVFAEFEFNGAYAVIKNMFFNRLVTVYRDSFDGYDMTGFDGDPVVFSRILKELKEICDKTENQRVVISAGQFNGIDYDTMRFAFGKSVNAGGGSEKRGDVLVAGEDGQAKKLPEQVVMRAMYKKKNPVGIVTFKNSRDADPKTMREFINSIYDKDGNMIVPNAAVDISNFRDNPALEQNFCRMVSNYVPTNAKDLPTVRLTVKQKEYRDGRWVFSRAGEDDYDRDWEDEPVFQQHPALAKKYGTDGENFNKYIVVDQLANESAEWIRIGNLIR